MESWLYWQKVVIVMLSIIVVVLAYRKLLRWIGGNSRFDDRFAFLQPIERVSQELLIVRFELPHFDTVTLSFIDQHSKSEIVVLDEIQLESGTHQFDISTSGWNAADYSCVLKSGNQRIERMLKFENNKI